LAGTAALATATLRSAQCSAQEHRVSQDELDEAIQLHSMWLADVDSGRRCVFAGRNLSGLKFGALDRSSINLSGADFTQTNLSDTEADDILFHHCSFNGAKFDGARWRYPVFAYADMRRVSAQRVEWGVSSGRDSAERLTADFSHTILKNADLTKARICGYFYSTRLGEALLTLADLSFSDFIGPKYDFEMSFSGARLGGAKLRHCHISSASFYNADCSEADFSRTIFYNVKMKGCNLHRARFRGAEVERKMFSPDQMREANLTRIIMAIDR
jgi:uncharacterized protein YjbI with pentapeptide repeats